MTIGSRIKQIRDLERKNQRDFAASIKISQPTLAMFENGQREPKEIHIEQICLKYGINDVWLRSGEGEMKVAPNPDDRFSINIAKLQRTDDETIMNWVNMVAETSPEQLRQIEAVFKKLLKDQ